MMQFTHTAEEWRHIMPIPELRIKTNMSLKEMLIQRCEKLAIRAWKQKKIRQAAEARLQVAFEDGKEDKELLERYKNINKRIQSDLTKSLKKEMSAINSVKRYKVERDRWKKRAQTSNGTG